MTTLTIDLGEHRRDPNLLQAIGIMLLSVAGMDLAGAKNAPALSDDMVGMDRLKTELATTTGLVPPAPIVPNFTNRTDEPLPEGWQHVEGGSAVVAVVPPVPDAPTAEVATSVVAPAVPAGTSDADGLQWDERIHSSSKALNADGTWRRRRNLDPAVLSAVEQELRGTPAPVVPPVPSAPAVPPPPPVPGVAVVPPVPPVAGVTYDGLMREVNQLIMTGKVAIIDVQTACSRHGLENLLELESRPDLLHAIANELAIGV